MKGSIASTTLVDLSVFQTSRPSVAMLVNNAITAEGITSTFSKSDSTAAFPRIVTFQFTLDPTNFPAIFLPNNIVILGNV